MQAITIFGSNSGNKRELLKKAIRVTLPAPLT